MDIDWAWIGSHLDDIAVRVYQHLQLVLIPLAVGFLISLVLAVWAVRQERVYTPITAVTGLLYTIPSLAAFAVLVPLLGFSLFVALIPLTTYTLLILFRNIVAGFKAVPPDVLEAAEGMGYTPRERLLRVEVPLAIPLMLAGVRLASVTTIGLATVAAILGDTYGGLGFFMAEGYQRRFMTESLVGAVLSVVLAFIADFTIVRIERLVTPWAHARAARA